MVEAQSHKEPAVLEEVGTLCLYHPVETGLLIQVAEVVPEVALRVETAAPVS